MIIIIIIIIIVIIKKNNDKVKNGEHRSSNCKNMINKQKENLIDRNG